MLPVRLIRLARVLPTVARHHRGPRVLLVLPVRKAPRHARLAQAAQAVQAVREVFRAPVVRLVPVDRVPALVVRLVQVELVVRPVVLAARPVRE